MLLSKKTKNKNEENTAPNKLPTTPPPPSKKNHLWDTCNCNAKGFTDLSTSVFNIGDNGASKVNLEIINSWIKRDFFGIQ